MMRKKVIHTVKASFDSVRDLTLASPLNSTTE